MGDSELSRDAFFGPPPAEIGVLAAQIYQALEAMWTQELCVKAEIRLSAARRLIGHPVQMIEPVEQSGHDCGVDAGPRAGKSLSRVDCEKSVAILPAFRETHRFRRYSRLAVRVFSMFAVIRTGGKQYKVAPGD